MTLLTRSPAIDSSCQWTSCGTQFIQAPVQFVNDTVVIAAGNHLRLHHVHTGDLIGQIPAHDLAVTLPRRVTTYPPA